MMKNPLLDIDFLSKLILYRQREVYARITALTLDELPIEYIEGKVTGGSVNVDGNSAVRRTCSLTMIAKEVNINDFYWGLKNKFKLEIGLKNMVDKSYPDMIWFKQGLFVITSFNTSQSTNNYTINISGKDKMCLLNGDLAGALPHTTDFGVEEYYDKNTGVTTYTDIPIKNIIREAVQNFGNELAHNIIINDIEDAGLELLEYRGNTPLFMFREINSDQFVNMTIQKDQPCYIDGRPTKISDPSIIYDNLVDLELNENATIIQLDYPNGREYRIAKFEYGSIPGYRLTDLTYAGELISNVGETITSMLDKIKNMLGEFEYFYDLDGRFIFQRKKNYINNPWNSLEQNDEIYADAAANASSFTFSFVDGSLITAFQNTPNLLNLRNDYSVWGTKKTTGGMELPIHMRYAIDFKPTEYTSIAWYDNDDKLKKEQETFTTNDWDWRELIYRMALDYRQNYHKDDFIYELAKANPQYPDGRTGYEQYYTDMEGFWRQLYNPDPELQFASINFDQAKDAEILHIQHPFCRATEKDLENVKYENLYVLYKNSIYPFIKGYCHLKPGEKYYYLISDGTMNAGTTDPKMLNSIKIEELYVSNKAQYKTKTGEIIKDKDGYAFQVFSYSGDNTDDATAGYAKFIDICYENIDKSLLFVKNNGYLPFSELDVNIQNLYYNGAEYQEYITTYKNLNNYGQQIDSVLQLDKVYYADGYYDFYHDESEHNYWLKDVYSNPEGLLFWFDFLDAKDSDIAKYAVPTVGARTKAINDKDVKSIYYREIPTTIFQIGAETYEHQTGYTYIQLQPTMENLFTISSKGKSAKERIDELMYNHSYCIESTNITAIPVYHLQPNSRIVVKDEDSKIDGEYIVSKITIPLTYNGTMSITATKAVDNLI